MLEKNSIEGVQEDLDYDQCVSVLSQVYNLFLFVLGDLKTEAYRLYVCINQLHVFTLVLNIRNIYSYSYLINVFLHELTHVIQKPHLGH
jgi:hypothetical protein